MIGLVLVMMRFLFMYDSLGMRFMMLCLLSHFMMMFLRRGLKVNMGDIIISYDRMSNLIMFFKGDWGINNILVSIFLMNLLAGR